MIMLQKYAGRLGAGQFRAMTFDEARNIPQNSKQWFHSLSNDARQAKVTSIKIWKRNLTRLEIHVKYGMYEYAVFDENDIKNGRMLVEL